MTEHASHAPAADLSDTPHGDVKGFVRHFRHDVLSGFLVFLIALPLCLGISMASGYPPIAGIFTAIIGGVLTTFLSNSELTIKGPAAGLIVIALGAVTELGREFGPGLSPSEQMALGYRLALGVGVAAGVIQILFGLFRAGKLGDFFPTSAVHGMLAAIGVIIIAKQVPVALGVTGAGGPPLEMLAKIPEYVASANPEIALIGLVGLAILFGIPMLKSRSLRRIPAPMLVLVVAVPMGVAFDLTHEHTYLFNHHEYHVGENFLVNLPPSFLDGIAHPDFRSLGSATGLRYVVMFALIGSLESLLSAKAIDLLDPWQRRTNLDRDLLAIGVGNTISASVGGLPMISEIVRSKANIDNGARTRYSDLYHGLFLLAFVALLPGLIHRIPLAALAAMLIYTGYRLASPREFITTFKVGKEQLLIFVVTLVAVLATDLLVGIGIGIATKFLLHLAQGVPPARLFVPEVALDPATGPPPAGSGKAEPGPTHRRVFVRSPAVFSNWLALKARIERLGPDCDITVDFSECAFVDHTVMEKLYEMRRDYHLRNRRFHIEGLDGHKPFSDHPHAARKKRQARHGPGDREDRLSPAPG
ncbi:MAG TPA: SulP family inorganic anion transporter [Gemmataceae bacterium]